MMHAAYRLSLMRMHMHLAPRLVLFPSLSLSDYLLPNPYRSS